MQREFRRRFRASWPALAFLAAASSVWAQMGPARVVVAPVTERRIVATVELVGVLKPLMRSTVAAEVAGIVQDLPVREGDRVEKGQIICQLRDTTLELRLQQAKALYERDRARLAELEAGTRPTTLALRKAMLEEARALLDRWQYEKERIDRLREQGSANETEYRNTTAQYVAAVKRVAQAQAAYREALEGPRPEEIAQARHALAAQQAAVELARDELEKTRIRAPFAGHVVRLATEVGEWVSQGGAVVELVRLDRVLARVDVPESAIPFVHAGDRVRVWVDALGRALVGRVKHVIPDGDAAAHTFPVEVEVDNPRFGLKPGMVVRVTVPAGPPVRSLAVPKDAVVNRQGAAFVAIVQPAPEGTMAMPVPVVLGGEDPPWVAVTSSSLRAGMQVAVAGHERLYGPQPVIVVGTWPGAGGKGPSSAPTGAGSEAGLAKPTTMSAGASQP